MRLRGLPREVNCGNVELTPAKNCRLTHYFRTCASCDFTHIKSFRLAECFHVHCESCLVFYEKVSDDRFALCSICNEPRVFTEERVPIETLYLAKFACPCGEEGNLSFLSHHRRICRQEHRERAQDLDSSQASASSTSSVTSTSSSSSANKRSRGENETPSSIEFMVKGYVAQELKRMKEDIINTTRMERQTSDTNIQRALDRADYLESRLDHFNTLETRLETVERSAAAVRSDPNVLARLSSIDIQVQGLRSGDYFRDVAAQQFTRLQSRSSFVWFDVKSLLRDFNRSRSAAETPDQSLVIAGYPCKFHLQIDQDEGIKSLLVYMGACEDMPHSASWPMRRQLTFKIYDTNGGTVFENSFSTTDASCRDYFKGPAFDSFGFYFGVELCTTEELTAESFYQRNNGMVCLGISVGPCGGTFFD